MILVITFLYYADLLECPELMFNVNNNDLKMERLIEPILALPGGGVLVVGRIWGLPSKSHLLRLDNKGSVVQTIIVTPDYIRGLTLIESDVLLLHDGFITRVRMRDGEVLNRYTVRGARCLRSGLVLDEDNILLVKGGTPCRVFTYSLSDGHTEDKVKNLNFPHSVTQIRTNEDTLFIVCESGSNRVSLYNSRWSLQRSITKTPNGPLDGPSCVMELPTEQASILIADYKNHRLSQFAADGRFIKHIIKGKHKIKYPDKLSYCHPYLYVTCGLLGLNCDVKCFKLYK